MTSLPPNASARDDVPTLLAAGAITYAAETMLHEAAGHGGVCLAEGHRVLALTPLWMRCSEADALLTAAGPAANVLAALSCLVALRAWRQAPASAGLLLWLGFAFNGLVACGYLGVGAAAGFGDWPVLFAAVMRAAAWRVPALLVAVGGYYACLRMAAWLFVEQTGGGDAAARHLRRRALLAGAGAAAIACLAEIVGGRIGLTPLLLALGSTAVVGYSLISMDGVVATSKRHAVGSVAIARAPWLIVICCCVAPLFVLALR